MRNLTQVAGSRNPRALADARELSTLYEGRFVAIRIDHDCGASFHVALPEDHEGCACICERCDQQVFD